MRGSTSQLYRDRSRTQTWLRLALLGVIAATLVAPPPVSAGGGGGKEAGQQGASTPGVSGSSVLRVLRVSPLDGTGETPRTVPILVYFDRPVVPLSALESPTPAAPVRFTPPIAGRGRWLNTSTWALYPAPALPGATAYSYSIAAGLRAVDGTALSTTYRGRFATVRPAVARTSPADGAAYTDFRAPLTVRFNQSVDHASVAAAFSLRQDGGIAVPGAYTWTRPDTLVFHPTGGLALGAHYSATMDAGLRSTEGPLPALGPATWSFSTAGALAVVDTSPSNGETDADLSGGVTIHLTAPVDPRLAQAHLRLTPRVPGLSVYVSDDGLLTVSGAFLPSTRYHLDLAGRFGTFGQTLVRPLRLTFTTAALPAAVQFAYGSGIVSFDAYRAINLTLQGVNAGAADLALYPLSRGEFASLLTSDILTFSPSAPAMLTLHQPLQAPLNQVVTIGQNLVRRDGSALAPGFYLLTAAGANGGSDRVAFMVTRTALTLKSSQGRVFVWATDLRTGRPLPNLPLRVTSGNGLDAANGRTDSDGVFDAANVLARTAPKDYSGLLAWLNRPGDASLVSSHWGSGVSAGDYNLPGSYQGEGGPSTDQGYLYTERPIYRPGQPVYFRGLVRHDDDGAYGLPVAGTPVHVTLTDSNGHAAYDGLLRLDRFGAFAGTIPLSASATLGSDNLQVQMEGQTLYSSVQVADYRTPDYAVAATSKRADGNYTDGGRVGVTLAAHYLFGAPLVNARVHWSVQSSDLYFYAPSYPDYTFQDYPSLPFPIREAGQTTRLPGFPAPAGGSTYGGPGSYGGPGYGDVAYGASPNGPTGPNGATVMQGDGRTDAHGNLALSLPANLHRYALSQQWSVEGTVTDLNNAQISGRATLSVHKGLFYVGLRQSSSLAVAGKPTTVDLLTIAQDGSTKVPGIPLALALYRRTYRTVTQQTANGPIYQWQPVDTLIRRLIGATGRDARGRISVTLPSSGEFRLVATARDAQGHTVRSALSLWAIGADEAQSPWANPPQDRISLVADRTLYRVGDVARVLVAAPRPGMTALVTIERGRVYSHHVVQLTGTSPVLRIPILPSYVPNMFVSVVVVTGTEAGMVRPLWKMGVVELPVDVRARRVTLTLRASTTHTEPGATLTLRLHAAGPDGRPVRGEFSLSMVDQGVLSLASDVAPAILDGFYAQRGLGVQTAYSQNIAAVQAPANAPVQRGKQRLYHVARVPAPASKALGGGGGGGGGGGRAPAIRARFPDTAYWNPTVTTDANGNATVSLTLPDSLTTWHILARGLTADTLVGETTLDVVATRALLLRPFVPRFFILGDQTAVGAAVDNTTARTLTAQVSLQLSGAAGGAVRTATVTVGPNGEQLVTWPLQPTRLGTLRLLLSAVAPSTGGDRVLATAPVEPNSTPETVATSGEVGSSRTEVVREPSSAQPGEGGLTLTLQPSLAAGLRSAVDYLQHDPYEYQSSIDLAARVMGEAALLRLPATATGLSPATLAAYRSDVADSIAGLLALQRYDGGWGWWIDSIESSPAVSAYCLDALGVARRAGYPVPDATFNQAGPYIGGQLQSAALHPLSAPTGLGEVTPDLQPYLAYVLDANGQSGMQTGQGGQGSVGQGKDATPGAPAAALYAARDRLPLWSRAYLLRALWAEAGGHLDARGHTLLTELEAGAHPDAAGAHWEGVDGDVISDDDVHATATVLDALLETDPTNPLIAPATRWLVVARHGEVWQTTIDNAVALRTLSDELRGSGELQGRYSYGAALNGQTWGTGQIGAATLGTPRVLRAPLAPGRLDTVVLTRSNRSGRLYYTLRLAYYPPVDRVPALSRGISVSRAYLYGGRPVGRGAVPAGAVVRVRLTVAAPGDLYYVRIEDPLPAGAEAVDPTLLTTSQLQSGGYTVPRGTTDLAWYLDHSELRDDRAVLFAGYLSAGTYRYEYDIHLTTPGVFHALPAHAQEDYFPEVFGRSTGGYLTVR